MPLPASTPAPAFRPELNGLRAVAVGVVVLQHWVRPPFPLGEIGPSLFFVLSGYLVSGIIWRYGAYAGAPGRWWPRVRTFYVRRALRILPAYYLALAGGALLPLATLHEHPGWFLLLINNVLIYKAKGWGDGIGHFWTIAVEAQFYLLWPFALGWLGRRLQGLLALALAGWCFRVLWALWVQPDMVHLLLPSSLDLFALGGVLCLAEGVPWLARLARGRYVLLAWLSWAALRFALDPGPWAAVWAVSEGSVLALADFLTIGWLLHVPAAGRRLGLTQPAMQWLGQRSYGLYLYHLPLFVFWQRLVYHFVPDAAGRATWMGPLPTLLVLGPVLAGLAAASWRFVEAPLDRLKKRFQYHKAFQAVVSAH